ncbi:MAG: ribosome small subunit-dependent GTPase A [Bacteroidales bacterium]|jgi:ribosome biogenesis GTPase|nr:ribosome small subunit-dependent GTPase A [Bacteroidales bacterium]
MKTKGIVIKSTGSWYEVMSAPRVAVACRLRGKFRLADNKNTNPVVVGDHVLFVIEPDGSGYITDILPRTNYIERKSTKLSKINHLIASNIDLALLVITQKEPRTSSGFVDRFLVSAEGFRIPVCLVFNKIDIYNPEEIIEIQRVAVLYENIGYQAMMTSAVTGEGIETLKKNIMGKVVLFSGHSGVGKSALANLLFPSLHLKTGEISSYHRKGKHTTTFAQMFPVDTEARTFVIDTPGIKEFGLIQYSKEEIRDYFPEIRKYNNCCRFNNCLHVQEPGCAVREAVQNEQIAPSRYYNYCSILQDEDLQISDWKWQ